MADKKAQLQISFPWIFAIIVGIFILFLAIYASTKLINVGQTQIDAETAKQIGVLTEPLETGFESSISSSMSLSSETKIYNKCEDYGNFGNQIIQISQKNFNKWSETDIDVSFKNKYIFSDSEVEGKEFYLFSKQFNFPFKIADLIIIVPFSNEYCFVDPPRKIEREIKNLENNFKISNCSPESIQICFNKKCKITVNYNNDEGYVEKNGKKMYFTDDLIYGAIFSSPEIYECQVKRLMKRTKLLSEIYIEKFNFMTNKCNTDLVSELSALNNGISAFRNSIDLSSIKILSEKLKNKNKIISCQLF